jgi:hypothetical protein
MATVAILIVLALLFGGVGLLIEGLRWALIIGVALLLLGAFAGLRARSGARIGRGRLRSSA